MLKKIIRKYNEIRQISESDVFIYTMGKVGSNSLSYSLEKAGLHPKSKHYFGGDQLHFFREGSGNMGSQFSLTMARNYVRYKQSKKIKIITLIRDPLARNLSLAFFFLDRILHQTLEPTDQRNARGKNQTIYELIEIAFKEQINHQGPLNWFDEEFGKVLGINVYHYPFDREAGYSIIEKGNLNILILQLEKIQQQEELIGQFLGLDSLELLKANQSANSWYSDIYKDFKKQFVPSDAYIKELYESKFMQHFYTKTQIEGFSDRWKRGSN